MMMIFLQWKDTITFHGPNRNQFGMKPLYSAMKPSVLHVWKENQSNHIIYKSNISLILNQGSNHSYAFWKPSFCKTSKFPLVN